MEKECMYPPARMELSDKKAALSSKNIKSKGK